MVNTVVNTIRRPLPVLAALLLGWLALAVPVHAEPQFPALAGRVTDAANIIAANDRARIDGKLAALEKQTGRQLVVATIPDLQGYEIADYGYQLGRHWAIGRKEINDGAILIVAPKERKLRIEVGYGLEGVLTDGLSSLIINQAIVPKFKQGDMTGGIEAGVDAIIAQLQLPPEQAQKLARKADESAAADAGGSWLPVVAIVVFFFAIVWLCSRGGKGRRYHSSGFGAPVVVWGSSGGDSGWSGSSGSDFSGGGGDFGGGGASGDW